MSFAKVHTALFTTKPFVNHSVHGRYGDNVEEMDWGVGQIMAAVEELGLRKNTFVYFTSDNGPYIEEVSDTGEYHGGWSGIYKGGRRNTGTLVINFLKLGQDYTRSLYLHIGHVLH